MNKKGIQYFTEEYLRRCKGMMPDQILEFLENYRMLVAKPPQKIDDGLARSRLSRG